MPNTLLFEPNKSNPIDNVEFQWCNTQYVKKIEINGQENQMCKA